MKGRRPRRVGFVVWEASCCGLRFINPGLVVGSGTDQLGLRGARGGWDEGECRIRIKGNGKESGKKKL